MTWRRSSVAVAAVLVLFSASGAVAAAAPADPSNDFIPIGTRNADMELAWDGPITALDWRNEGYAVAGNSFVGRPVSVPGDRVHRTAVVRNDGPSAAQATVQIVDVAATDPSDSVNDDLMDCIHLFAAFDGEKYDATWRAAMSSADHGISWESTIPVPQGASFRLSVGVYFPLDETRGNDLGKPSQQLTFSIQVIMVGDTSTGEIQSPPAPVAPGEVTGAGDSSAPEVDPSASGVSDAPDYRDQVAPTGGSVLLEPGSRQTWMVALLAGVLAGLIAWLQRRWSATDSGDC